MTNSQEISPKRIQEIIELAEVVASEYGVQGRLNPVHIIQDNKIGFCYGQYKHHFDGMLTYFEGRFFIYCNLDKVQAKDSPRARFTLCHELGHFFIDEHRRVLMRGENLHHPSHCDFSSKLLVEQEADLFASYLLMPSFAFDGLAGRKKAHKGIEEVLFLKNHFQTSITSTALRYVKSNVTPCAMFIWNTDQSLKWHWKSDVFFSNYLGKPVANCLHLGRTSATIQAFSSDEIRSSGSTIATFFENVPANDKRNCILIEESLRLGEFGILTLVYPDGQSISFDDFASK
jgi:Zn-dependent peptidase ImmA (M78 family)